MWLHYVWYRIKIRYQINTVPTPTAAWTRAWLGQRGGGYSNGKGRGEDRRPNASLTQGFAKTQNKFVVKRSPQDGAVAPLANFKAMNRDLQLEAWEVRLLPPVFLRVSLLKHPHTVRKQCRPAPPPFGVITPTIPTPLTLCHVATLSGTFGLSMRT